MWSETHKKNSVYLRCYAWVVVYSDFYLFAVWLLFSLDVSTFSVIGRVDLLLQQIVSNQQIILFKMAVIRMKMISKIE